MTMAVGFLRPDGVVIGADRQITGANYTFPERKIESFHWQNGAGVLAYSGDRDVFRDFLANMYGAFGQNVTRQENEVRPLIKQCLDALHLKKNDVFLTLFGYLLRDRPPRLVLSNSRQRVVSAGLCEVIGYGDSPLSRSFLGRYLDVPLIGGIKQASIYAVDFISQAKRYDGQYVGDGIDVFSIDRSGVDGTESVHVLDAGRTGQWENRIATARYWLDVFFNELSNTENPMINVEMFKQRMGDFRQWAGGDPIPWSAP
ncbi:MAG: hypothetical protein ABSC62_05475 [Terracidiphilus sp.]